MSASLTREEREDRIRDITRLFRDSRLFKNRPGPRQDVKPSLAEHLVRLIDGGSMRAGDLLSGGLVGAALAGVGWKISDSTVATVLWHLSRLSYLEFDGLYYKIPVKPGPPRRVEIGPALKEFARRHRKLAVINCIAGAGVDATGSEAGARDLACWGLAGEALPDLAPGAGERNFVRRLRLVEFWDANAEARRMRLIAWELYLWPAGTCSAIREEFARFALSGVSEMRRERGPRFEVPFRAGFRTEHPDRKLLVENQSLRVRPVSGQAACAFLREECGIAADIGAGEALCLSTLARAGGETILVSLAILPGACDLELGMDPPRLVLSFVPDRPKIGGGPESAMPALGDPSS